MSDLSENLKNYRLLRKITQRELAEQLNKSVNTVANWENGKNSFDVELLPKICKILNVTPNQLCGFEETPELCDYILDKDLAIERKKKLVSELDQRLLTYQKIFDEVLNNKPNQK